MADDEQRGEALVEEGLGHYSQGQLDSALSKWREALTLAPENVRAREYLKYVEDNRAALEDSFALAHTASGSYRSAATGAGETAAAAAAAAAPVPEPTPASEPSPAPGSPASEERVAQDGKARRPEEDLTVTRIAKQQLELSREVVEVELPGRVPAQSAATPPRDTPAVVLAASQASESDDDSSFSRLAAEIVAATTALSERGELTEPGPAPPVPAPANPPPTLSDEDALELEVSFAEEGEDHTPRIDLGALKAKVAATKRRLSQEMKSVPKSSPDDERRTPLTVIGGGGERREEDFEPLEATPVATRIPTPARLVPSTPGGGVEPLEDAPAAVAELAREPLTSSRLSSELGVPAPVVGSGMHGALEAEAEEKRPGISTCIGLGPRAEEAIQGETSPAGGGEDFEKPPRATPSSLGREVAGGEKLESMLAGARQLHEQGTFEGSLWLCERVLALQPEHAEAKRILDANRQVLLDQYRKQLGDPRQVPVVQIPQHEIVWHKLDHRAGFLLSRIDGQLSFEDLLDVSGMNEFEAYRILAQLTSQGVIGPRR
jgi:hypothetical protein